MLRSRRQRHFGPYLGTTKFGMLRASRHLIGDGSPASDVPSTRSVGPCVVTTYYLDQEV